MRIIGLRLIDGYSVEAMVRCIRADKIEVKVYKKIGVFTQALYCLCLFPNCIVGVDFVSHWGTFLLPDIIRQRI